MAIAGVLAALAMGTLCAVAQDMPSEPTRVPPATPLIPVPDLAAPSAPPAAAPEGSELAAPPTPPPAELPGERRAEPPALPPGAGTGVVRPAVPTAFPVPTTPMPRAPIRTTAPLAGAAPSAEDDDLIKLDFVDTPLDVVLQHYGSLTDRSIIQTPGLTAAITLRAHARLSKDDALAALDAVLAMNNISLVPMGETFWKAVATPTVRQEGTAIQFERPKAFAENDKLITQLFQLENIELSEIVTVIQSLLHGYGKLQALERTNSVLVTDTASNLQRITELLDFVDKPSIDKEETRVIQLNHAKAADVASRLNEIIAESQQQQAARSRVNVTVSSQPSTPPGVIRPPSMVTTGAATGERGLVRGRVKIVSDERTNILIIVSRPENFEFFDQIIQALDKEVEPEISVRVVSLEFASAEEISDIINQLITGSSSRSASSRSTRTGATGPSGAAGATSGSTALRDFVNRRVEQDGPTAAQAGEANLSKLGETTRVLSDERSNSVLLMGRQADLDAIEEQVIKRLDIMLAQVVIEAVIIEVNLSDGVQYGFDWLQRSMTTYNEEKAGPNGGLTVSQPIMSFAGGQQTGSSSQFQDASALTGRDVPLTAGGLSYYLTLFDLNIDAVLRMAATSSDARILSTPVVLTTDNKEASIVVGEDRPVVTSSGTTSAGEQRSTYEYKNIGINLTVTPRINPQRMVIMEVSQTVDNVGDTTRIDGNDVPIITKREVKAELAVPSRSTIVLGGLVSTDKRKTQSKIPLLGDIPLLGAFFRSESNSDTRRELLVLLTPYVLLTSEEAAAETERLHRASSSSRTKWHKGWSDSPLVDIRTDGKEDRTPLLRRSRTPREAEPQVLIPTEPVEKAAAPGAPVAPNTPVAR